MKIIEIKNKSMYLDENQKYIKFTSGEKKLQAKIIYGDEKLKSIDFELVKTEIEKKKCFKKRRRKNSKVQRNGKTIIHTYKRLDIK